MASSLPDSGVDRERISNVCCYASMTLSSNNSSKCSEVKESRRATDPLKGHVNGHGEPSELVLPLPPLPTPLKSSLKRSIRLREQQEMEMDGRRKVRWPDAHGRDLAHVQVFQSSAPDDGDFLVRGKSCICNIQ